MKSLTLVILLLFLFNISDYSQTKTKLTNFIDKVNSLPLEQKAGVVDSFMNTISSFPLIENDTIASFIYRGSANSVSYSGEVNSWSTTPMKNLEGTDFWYLSRIYESDARLDYKFVVNGTSWITDPRNQYTVMGLSLNSELRMSKYPLAPEILYDENIPHGQIITSNFTSSYLGNTRQIKVYLPPLYSTLTSKRYPLVIFHDGLEFITNAQANNTLDYLIYNKQIEPIVCVFIPPVDRRNEYVGTKIDLFASFISEEIIPFMNQEYRIASGAEHVASIGISNGADISQYLGYKLSKVIGNIGCMSAAGNWHTSKFSSSPKLNLKFYVDAGTYDLPGFLNNNQQFVNNILKRKGYPYEFNVYHEGHSWGNWRAHLDNSLKMFFPYVIDNDTIGGVVNQQLGLINNSPNPFVTGTVLHCNIPQDGHVIIKIFEVSGSEIAIVQDGFVQKGESSFEFLSKSLSGGVYYATMWLNGERLNSIKMILVK